jgi:single-strand DNA-binding protein
MAQDPIITVLGNVGTKPEHKVTSRGTPVTTFRIGHTPSRYNRQINRWEDLETSWYTVTCWYEWGANVVESFNLGDPVVVMGRLRISEWKADDGRLQRRAEINAVSVGHDLRRGSAKFTKVKRERPSPIDDQQEVDAMIARHEQEPTEDEAANADPWQTATEGEFDTQQAAA